MNWSQPSRVLVCMPDTLGLCMSTLPLLAAVRRHFPDILVAGLATVHNGNLPHPHPEFDEWTELPQRPGMLLPMRARLARRLGKVDLVLDATGDGAGAWPGWWCRAPKRIGLRSLTQPWTNKWLYTDLVRPPSDAAWAQRLRLLQPLGIVIEASQSALEASPETITQVNCLLRDAHFTCDYAALHMDAVSPEVDWPAEQFGKLARFLGQQHRVPSLLLWQGRRGRQLAERAAKSSGGHAWIAPTVSWSAGMELVRRAKLLVSSDHQLVRLGAAIGTLGVCPGDTAAHRPPANPRHADLISLEGVASACQQALAASRPPGQAA